MSQKQDTQINNETPPPFVLLQMITGRWVSQIIYVAAKLGIADLLSDGAKSRNTAPFLPRLVSN